MAATTIPFGLRGDGRMVTVSEVPRGRQCGCVCPACESPLEAQKGELRPDYFAHQPGSIDCKSGFETALHRMAKQIIADAGGLAVPQLKLSASEYDNRYKQHRVSKTVTEDSWQPLSGIELERQIDPLRPDVIGYHGDRKYAIEIYVTHKWKLQSGLGFGKTAISQ